MLSVGGLNTLSPAASIKRGTAASCMAKPPPAGRNKSAGVLAAAAATADGTTWDFWSSSIAKRKVDSDNSSQETNYSKDLAASIASAAATFKPKCTQSPDAANTFKWSQMVVKEAKALPKDLHEKLEAIGLQALKGTLGLKEGTSLDVATLSMTTTDVDAGISATGAIRASGSNKMAVIALVATETSRQASWSRLEGLLLHWAVSDRLGGAWNQPPDGWTATPSKSIVAGSAMDSQFEKQRPEGQEPVYVLVLQLPLVGVLKNGGITFVLKATAGQNTRWLQDAATSKDFFVPLQSFPLVNV